MKDYSQTQWDINGKTCLITGANSGIGLETAVELAKLGAARLILACRDIFKGEMAASKIQQEQGWDDDEAKKRITVKYLDLASLITVKQLADEIIKTESRLHVLINNAGIFPPGERTLTSDGIELCFATNYLGHFFLTKLLLDFMRKSAPCRIINLSSNAYKLTWPFGGFHIDDPNYDESPFYEASMAYAHSKLATALFTVTLNCRLNENGPSGISVFSVHPGQVKTDLLTKYNNSNNWLRKIINASVQFFAKNIKDGAKTTVYCATMPSLECESGQFFV